MIGLHDDNGTSRLAVAYNGVALNTLTLSSAGARSLKYGTTTEVVGTRTAMDYLSEPNQWLDGIELYGMRKTSRIVVLRGFTFGRDISELYDNCAALGRYTDPSLISFQNPTAYFLPLTFSTPTRDTTNFPTGLAASKYVGIPIRMIEPQMMTAGNGLSAQWELNLLLQEPKRFLQTASTRAGAGTTTNIGTDRSYPVLTFTLSGGGAAAFTIQNVATYQGTVSLVLDLSAYNSGTWTVDFRERSIKQGTTVRPDVFVSGDFFSIEPGSNVISYTDSASTTGAHTLTYYPSYPL